MRLNSVSQKSSLPPTVYIPPVISPCSLARSANSPSSALRRTLPALRAWGDTLGSLTPLGRAWVPLWTWPFLLEPPSPLHVPPDSGA